MTRHVTPHTRSAFTLVEVIFAIVIIGALFALMTPQLASNDLAQREAVGLSRVQAAVQLAQGEAIRSPGAIVQLSFETSQVQILRAGVPIPQDLQLLPAGITIPTPTVVSVQSDGTLSTAVALSLTSTEFTYALTVDRNGIIRH